MPRTSAMRPRSAAADGSATSSQVIVGDTVEGGMSARHAHAHCVSPALAPPAGPPALPRRSPCETEPKAVGIESFQNQIPLRVIVLPDHVGEIRPIEISRRVIPSPPRTSGRGILGPVHVVVDENVEVAAQAVAN